MEQDRVRVEIDGDGVAAVAMNRPDEHNALDPAMFDGLVRASEAVAADPKVRAVVLFGEGPSFCSGLDLASFLRGSGDIATLMAREEGQVANHAQRVAYQWRQLPVPVIAAITGNCFGGGLQIALGADIRVATPTSKLSIMEVQWGLVPDMAITQTLPPLVGLDVAKELTFTGRIVAGSQARELGLVTRTADDPVSEAFGLAGEIAGKSPDAIRAAKRLLNETWAGNDPKAALALESELQVGLYGGANQMEAVAAGMQKRPPRFTDPV